MNTCTGCGYPFLLRGTLCTQCEDKATAAQATTEHTDQGEQIVLPGAERSARQAAASRGERIKPKVSQRDPGGLFEPKEPEQPKLF